MFKQEFEFLTSNTKINYPFVEQVTDPVSTAGYLFSDLVADAYILYTPTISNSPVKLASMSEPTGSSISCEFQFEDGSTAFTSSSGVASSFGSWIIVEWTEDDGSARVLLEEEEAANYSWPITLTDAYLLNHVTQEVMPTLKQLVAVLDESTEFDLSGTVELEEGYNIEITPSEVNRGARGVTQLNIAAIQGAGAGSPPGCEINDKLLTVNNIAPNDKGDLILTAQDCYRFEYPLSSEVSPGVWQATPNQLKFYNQCEPCCQCEDYVYLYDVLLRGSYDKAKDTSEVLYGVLTEYEDLRNKLLAEKAAREGMAMEVRAVSKHGWTTSAQVIVYNNTEDNISDIDLEVNFSSAAQGELVLGSAFLHNDQQQRQLAPVSGSYPTFLVNTALDINFTKLLVLTLEVYFPEKVEGVDNPRSAGAEVTVTANGIAASQGLPEASAVTYMLAPFNKG